MKSLKKVAFLAGLAGGLLVSAKAQPVNPPGPNDNQAPTPPDQAAPAQPGNDQPAPMPGPGPDMAPPPGPAADDAGAPPGPPEGMVAPGDGGEADAAPGNDAVNTRRTRGASLSPNASITLLPPATSTNDVGEKLLRMNFREAPLDQVLAYMSDAAGFIIVLDTQVGGSVSVMSSQPVTKTEAVSLLNAALNKNGYACVREGRTLTIMNRADAQKRDIPVKIGNNPPEIPKNAEIVTQIIPVRSLNAMQLTKDLSPLLPNDTTLTANEAGNALVMTDTQVNIHRVAEIVKALDTVSSSVNSIKVFPLQYADSKTMVSVIEKLFPNSDSTSSTGAGAGGRGGGRGGNPMAMMFGGMGMGGSRGGSSGGSSGSKPSARVLAVSDDNSNTLIVSAPDEILDPLIIDLVKSLDTPITDITELHVFPLLNSDPSEMASLLTSLFPDDNSSSSTTGNNGNRFQMGGFGGMGGRGGNGGNNNGSSRSALKKGRVIAVPDPRTSSVVVSADKSLMGQIETMIQKLDESPAKKQRVFVYTLMNADVQDVAPVLEDLFQSSNSRNRNSSSQNQQNALTIRNNQMQQQQSYSTSGSGFGSSSSSGR